MPPSTSRRMERRTPGLMRSTSSSPASMLTPTALSRRHRVLVRSRAPGGSGPSRASFSAPLPNTARRYVQQFRTAQDSQLWVSFDGAAIERWLTQNGQPLWGRERPSTLVWLSVATGPQSTAVVSADDSSELKDAMDAAALLRGIPLVWPPAASANAAANAPADVARRLGAEGVLVGRANNAAATAAGHWTLQLQDRSSEFSGALGGANRACDLDRRLFAASGTLATVPSA